MVTTKTSKRNRRTPPARENVKTARTATSRKQGFRTEPKLQRTTFSTSREMDFFSERELVTQTGHPRWEWPRVIAKELIDNSLDASEEAGTAPVVTVTVDGCGITVSDNGPGLPPPTLLAALDFSVRASNREAYVAPDRGAQGNALKTLLPMPRVLDAEHGRFIIAAHGKRHVIVCSADPVSQRAVIRDEVAELPTLGTSIRIEWGQECWPFGAAFGAADGEQQFAELIAGFALFNPHATFHLDWHDRRRTWQATDPGWQKWLPTKPTSAHWYELRHLERLIGAYLMHDREAGTDRLVSDFVAEFDGLTGSQKRAVVLDEADMRRVKLSELVAADGLDSGRVQALLHAMQRHTRPVKPKRLGIIGEPHLRARLLELGVQEDSFTYKRRISKGGLPWVLESAFGCLADAEQRRHLFAGANWSAAIRNPFRSFGQTGEGLETVLADMRATRDEPIVFVLHMAHPRAEYTDRGKSALVIGGAA